MSMEQKKHGRPPALAEINFQKYAAQLEGKSHSEIFSVIHEENVWGAQTSNSGLGSELDATQLLRSEISALVKQYQIQTVLDIPCGDLNWMRHMKLPLKRYIGADIVEEIIHKIKNEDFNLSTNSGETIPCEYVQMDIIKDDLPTVDLILCRDCLVHFSFKDIQQTICNIKRSRSKYFLTTTFTDFSNNIDIQTGDWRPLNFEASPFNFPPAIEVFKEGCKENDGAYADKSMGLWQINNLPEKFSSINLGNSS